jgi:DHA1 family tetracycline resistance protein-like MFS transporter
MVFGLTFAWAVSHDASLHAPGLPIFIAAGLLLSAFMLAVRVGHAPAKVAAAPAE